MGKFWKVLAQYDAETKTYTEAAGTPASPFTPDFNGKLIALRVIIGGAAATTLTELIQFKLTSTTFVPNAIEVVGIGNGLRTAPAMNQPPTDFIVDQAVKASIKITVEGRNVTADTPVTVEAIVMGLFQT